MYLIGFPTEIVEFKCSGQMFDKRPQFMLFIFCPGLLDVTIDVEPESEVFKSFLLEMESNTVTGTEGGHYEVSRAWYCTRTKTV